MTTMTTKIDDSPLSLFFSIASTSNSVVVWTTLGVIILSIFYFYSLKQRNGDMHSRTSTTSTSRHSPCTTTTATISIPWAPGAIPVLGHALRYRQDPSGFLVRTSETVGGIFQLNLAGKHMIVVTTPEMQRTIASAPESVLSARQAVADIGFEQTLGHRNVHEGTDIHKAIVKGIWHTNQNVVAGWLKSLQRAWQVETAATQTKEVEFLAVTRRVMLRVTMEQFLGTTFLEDWDFSFLEEFMSFQDELEDVTAKSVVLPRWISLPLMLWPLQKRRECLQQRIAQHLQRYIARATANTTTSSAKDDEDDANNEPTKMGFWLAELHAHYEAEEIAEYVVGLLFAAHKNPAIAAAQSYLMLWERGTVEQQAQCSKDAKALLENPDWSTLQSSSCTTLRHLTLESLRLTAHSIGAVRTAQRDVEVPCDGGDEGGDSSHHTYRIPQGASVALAHIATSLNPNVWKNPAQLDVTRAPELYKNDYQFTTFSHGIHKCPGQQLAVIMVQCTVAILLQEYDIILPTPIPPLSFERATLAQRESPVNVTIIHRKEPKE